jgi:uncharacterized protein (DUF1778 family)
MPPNQSRATVYRNLPADERQEFRLPSLLKDHLARAAALTGQSLAEYISTALAERVSRDLATNSDWALTVDEQTELMRILASSGEPSARARVVAARADELFGNLKPLTSEARRTRG